MTTGWKVECVSDAPMRTRAWFADLADAQAWGEERFSGAAVITPELTPDGGLAAARIAEESAAEIERLKEELHDEREKSYDLQYELDDAEDRADKAERELARLNARSGAVSP